MSKRVAFYCGSSSWGGLEMNLVKRAVWWQNRGHQVSFYAQEGSRSYQEALNAGVKTHHNPKNKKYFAIGSARKLWKQLKQSNVEVLIVSDPKDLSLAAWVKTFAGKKIKTLYIQVMQIGINKRDLIHTIRFNKLDAWITPLPYLKTQMEQRTRFNMSKVSLIPMGIDISRFSPLPDKSVSRSALNLPQDKTIVGLLGRIDEQKGQMVLLEAMVDLLKKNDQNHLCFMGEKTHGEGEAYYEDLIARIHEAQLESQVSIIPFSPNVPGFMAAIDIFVMATNSETYGMVTVEAMVCGKTIVGSDSAGTAGLLENGKWGHLFQPMDSGSLRLELVELLGKDNFEQMELRDYASKEYDKDLECERIESVINQL